MRILLLTALVLGCVGMAAAQQATDHVSPEAATTVGQPDAFAGLGDAARAALQAKSEGRPVMAQDWMVSAAHPMAVEAGARVLEQGGSAADAMIAVQVVLGLVEPQSSGLGGGAFLVWYDAETGRVTTLDARETAPMAAAPLLFQQDGEPLAFMDAVIGGRSVGTPGTPALLEEAHRRWGRANWASLFQDGIHLAENGFTVSPRLADLVAGEGIETLGRYEATRDYFFPDGQPITAGQTLTNPAYADVLRRLAAEGSRAFYHGPIAQSIVSAVRGAKDNPGVLALSDLAAYRVIERPAICVEYRAHDVCGMGPPSSGALTLGQILGMLEGYDLASLGPQSPESWRLIGDASRLAFADRGRYIADMDYVPVPVQGLIAPGYLAERAALLAGDDSLPEVAPGQPEWSHARLWGQDRSLELPSTSHISIMDGQGNALSMTTTIENGFGSRLMAEGFLLNNELTDFSFETVDSAGWPIANRVEPGKRPRSSMAPSIVLKDGAPVLVIGSPGGSRIIGYVANAIIASLDWGMDVQQAVSAPHLINRFGTMDVEAGTDAAALIDGLAELGFEINETELTSGLQGIAITPHGLQGGADPRREGIAIGG